MRRLDEVAVVEDLEVTGRRIVQVPPELAR